MEQPAWVSAAVAVVSAIGGALMVFIGLGIGQWFKWKRGTTEIRRGDADLDIHITDTTIQQWKTIAKEANARAMQAITQGDERVNKVNTYWQTREALYMKEFQEREKQFTTVLNDLRERMEAKYDRVVQQNEKCERENEGMRVRVEYLEMEVSSLKDRVEARESRKDPNRTMIQPPGEKP